MDKTFWNQVRQEIDQCPNKFYLCHMSQSFQKVWEMHPQKIKDLGEKFLIQEKEEEFTLSVSDYLLFTDRYLKDGGGTIKT